MSEIEITVLVENRAEDGLIAEHGLALWIEAGGRRVLFDTGAGEAIRGNAEKLGIDLSKAEFIVLSHGHYDHTGGLADVLEIARDARIIMHPGAYRQRYSIHAGKPAREIGMPAEVATSLRLATPERILHATMPTWITDQIAVTGQVPRNTPYEDTGGPFYLDSAGLRADDIIDDQALYIRTDTGVVVCLGCGHSGTVNTLNYIAETTDEARVLAVIGGMHLLHAGRERMTRTIAALLAFSPEFIAPCHCTGREATEELAKVFGGRFRECRAGTRFVF